MARTEADAAWLADEEHIAHAFEAVATTVVLDAVPAPPEYGRDVLMGRATSREKAIELAESGLSARVVARVVGVPYITVYTWLRRAGVAPTRAEWRSRRRRVRGSRGP